MSDTHNAETVAPESAVESGEVRRVRVLNLGAGNDSTALLLGSGEGVFDRIDFAIFSDTGWEPKRVYEHLTALQRVCDEKYGIPIHLASRGRLQDDVLDRRVFATLPAWTLDAEGKRGRIIRQCTPKYKVEPIEQKLRELCGAPVWMEECRFCEGTGQRLAPWDTAAGVGSYRGVTHFGKPTVVARSNSSLAKPIHCSTAVPAGTEPTRRRSPVLRQIEQYRRKRKVRSCNPFGCRVEEMDDPVPVVEEASGVA